MMKKIFSIIKGLLLLGCVGVLTVVAIRSPMTFKDVFNGKTNIQQVPYGLDFENVTGVAGYKSSYFSGSENDFWYSSWGNVAQRNANTDMTGIDYSYLLGWNEEFPTYGSYSYKDEVVGLLNVPSDYHYSYVIMDFDFNQKHTLDFTFTCFDDIEEGSITLITSINGGGLWQKAYSIEGSDKLLKDKQYNLDFESLNSIKIRYGLLISSPNVNSRVELNYINVKAA